MTYPCPYCSQPASVEAGCPSCGRGPDLDAIEVVRVDAEIADLSARLAGARQAVAEIEGRLGQAWSRRHTAAARVRASVLASHAPAGPPPAAPQPPVSQPKEVSTKLVQNALFLLGGLLLGIAAIVFTAVAWAQFGVGGRAALLAFFTAVTLTVPVFALRRNLAATAETFAAVGLLLVLLDGYAAWHVNLLGVADGSGWGYAGAVCAVTAAVAAGYERLTGLQGPRFAALAVAQPVLPLLVADAAPGAAGWAFTFAAVAALNVAVLRLRRDATGLIAAAFGAAAMLIAAGCALTALGAARAPAPAALAGLALLAAAAVLVVAGRIGLLDRSTEERLGAGHRLVPPIVDGVFVVALGIAAARVAALLTPGSVLLRVAVAVLVVALLVAAAGRFLDVRGPRIGVLVVLALPGVTALAFSADAALRTLVAAQPFFGAPFERAVPAIGGQLPASVAVLVAALLITLPGRWRRDTALVAAAVLALALPAGLHLGWWTGPVGDLVVVSAALALALRSAAPALAAPAGALAASPVAASPSAPSAAGQALTAVPGAIATVALGAHAVVAGLGRPAVAAGVFAVFALLGLGVAALARGPRRADLGAAGLAAGLLALPALAWTSAAAAGTSGLVQARLVLAVSLALTAVPFVLGRAGDAARTRYRTAGTLAGLVALVPLPLWALLTGDSPAIYAAAGLVALAPVGRIRRAVAGAAALPLAAALLIALAPALSEVLVLPYEGIGRLWTGAVEAPQVPVTAAVAAALLVAAAAWFDRRCAAPVAVVAVALVLSAAGLPWPVVAAAELLLGLALLLAAALRPVPVALPVTGVLLAAPGLAALLPARASTLAGLGAIVVAGAVAGAVGRAGPARVAGWLSAIGAAVLLAVSAGLDLRMTAFLVLGVAGAAAALAWLVLDRRVLESRAVAAAAHAGAVVAVLLTIGSAGHAAAVCALWGLVLGLRALRPAGRPVYLVMAAAAQLAAWCLVLAAQRVTVVEAYTIGAAAVCLLAGLLARRGRTDLSSWTAYGPALAAALLPSLGTILAGDGQHLRRLLLGLAALAVVLLGARARLRAPVLLGGAVLLLVALHELAQVWDLIPRWIPLAAGGLLLVVLATTLERRRRDLDRFRAALHRMS